MQEDPHRGDGLNLYAYCGNNPVKYYDPSGYMAYNKGDIQAGKSIDEVADGIINGERINTALTKSDSGHRAASFLSKEQLVNGQISTLTGKDKIEKILLQVEGELNGKKGIFEYLLTPDGLVSHQRFVTGGKYTPGVINQRKK